MGAADRIGMATIGQDCKPDAADVSEGHPLSLQGAPSYHDGAYVFWEGALQSLSIPAVTALIVAIVSSSVLAQQAPPVRIRGTIEKVDGNTLMVKARDGSSVKVTLAENARVTAMVKAQLSDIKQGSFIGVTAMPQPDGSQKAIGLHIFLESQKRVVPDRHFPWDRQPGRTMTNANVESTVSGVDGQTIMVKYKDGEKKVIGSSRSPPQTVIRRFGAFF